MNAPTISIPINKIEKIWIDKTIFFIEGLAYLQGYDAPDYRYLHKHIKFRNLLDDSETEFVLGTVPKRELVSQPYNGKNYNYTAAGTATQGFKGIDIGFFKNGLYEIQISVVADKNTRNYTNVVMANIGLNKHSADDFSEYRLYEDGSRVYLAKKDIFGSKVPIDSHISVENSWSDGAIFHVEGEFIVPDVPLSNFSQGKYYLIAKKPITQRQYVSELGQVRKSNLGLKIGKSTTDYNASYFATLGLKGIETQQFELGIYDLYVSLAYGNRIFTVQLDKQLMVESRYACTLVDNEKFSNSSKEEQHLSIFEKNKFFRSQLNEQNKQRLANNNFTMISSNCNGSMILSDLGMQFKSPFVNLYVRPSHFVKYLSNIQYYRTCELNFIKEKKENFPIAYLDDVEIRFLHYSSEEEARTKWESRNSRMNMENFFVIMSERDGCTYEDLKKFDDLPIENKVVFTHKPYPEFKSAYYIPGFEKDKQVGVLLDFSGCSGYRYFDCFDYISWFNGDSLESLKGKQKNLGVLV